MSPRIVIFVQEEALGRTFSVEAHINPTELDSMLRSGDYLLRTVSDLRRQVDATIEAERTAEPKKKLP
jgi:hypothetical protein